MKLRWTSRVLLIGELIGIAAILTCVDLPLGLAQESSTQLEDVRFQGSVAFFKTNDDTVGDQFVFVLNEIAALLCANDRLYVAISGYTDSRGKTAFNNALAENRAERVADRLEDQGVMRERIIVVGPGNPSEVINDQSGRMQLDRRVDVVVGRLPQELSR